MRQPTGILFVEECWTLVGARRGRVWLARRVRHRAGEPVSVSFDATWAVRREEQRGDVVGFLHTHPPAGPLRPSARDVRTMRAWCPAFGKPLLCLIGHGPRLAGFVFDEGRADYATLAAVEVFPRGVVVGVEGDGDGGQVRPRRTLPRRRRPTGETA